MNAIRHELPIGAQRSTVFEAITSKDGLDEDRRAHLGREPDLEVRLRLR
jgi:hypothetical protein